MLNGYVKNHPRKYQQRFLARDLVQGEQTFGHACVIVKHAVVVSGMPITRSAAQSIVVIRTEVNRNDKVRCRGSRIYPVGTIEQGAGLRQCSNGQAIPRRHHLVIA